MSYEKHSPQALEAEELILGAILLSNHEGLNEVLEYALSRPVPLAPEQFHSPVHRFWLEVFCNLHGEGKSIGLGILHDFADESHPVQQPIDWIMAMESYRVSGGDRKTIEELIDVVQEKYARRQLIAHYQNQAKYIYDPTLDTDSAISHYQTAATNLGDSQKSNVGLLTIAESLVGTFEQLEARISGDLPPALRTGWYDFDDKFGGVPDGMSIFMGRPAMGKTAAALSVALNVAKRGESVLIFSLEMSANQLNNRLLSMVTGIDGWRLRRGKLHDGEEENVVEAIAYLSTLPIFIMDCPTSVEDVNRKVTGWARKHEKAPALVIVDYLQLLVTEDKKRDTYAEIGHISRQLQRMSKFFKIRPSDRPTSFPLIAVCQLSRAVETRPNKRPIMSDLRDSGQLEQDAEFIVGFYRDEYYNEGTNDVGIAEAIAVKNRDGSTGTVKLLFQAETTCFHNLAGAGGEHGAF